MEDDDSASKWEWETSANQLVIGGGRGQGNARSDRGKSCGWSKRLAGLPAYRRPLPSLSSHWEKPTGIGAVRPCTQCRLPGFLEKDP